MRDLEIALRRAATGGMICWDRRGEQFVGVFDEFEVGVLKGYAEALLVLLEHRSGSYSLTVAGEFEARLPDEVTTDPRLIAILRDQSEGPSPDWMLAWSEAECLSSVADAVRTTLRTLPAGGGLVQLASQAEAAAWVRAMHIYLVSVEAVTDRSGRFRGRPVGPTVDWLHEIKDGLLAVMAGNSRVPAEDSRSSGR